MIGRFIASQYRTPSGLLGRLIGNGMARGNKAEARWTADLLDIQPDSHVLDIGFGPGVAIQNAAEQAAQGHVSGIDCSATMVRAARKRNASAIRNGLLAITILPIDRWPPERRTPMSEVFKLYRGGEIAQMVADTGFREARVKEYPQPDKFPGKCTLAVK